MDHSRFINFHSKADTDLRATERQTDSQNQKTKQPAGKRTDRCRQQKNRQRVSFKRTHGRQQQDANRRKDAKNTDTKPHNAQTKCKHKDTYTQHAFR